MPGACLLLDLEANQSSLQQGTESSLVGAINSLKRKCHTLMTGQGRKRIKILSLYRLLSQRVHSKCCHLQVFPFVLSIMKISGSSRSCKTPCRPSLDRERIQIKSTWFYQKETEIISSLVYMTYPT